VDLFSLGVVAFELWHPFSTGMERALLLRDLREGARLPEAWERAHPVVARLIRWVGGGLTGWVGGVSVVAPCIGMPTHLHSTTTTPITATTPHPLFNSNRPPHPPTHPTRWLMAPKPADRPSARQVLQSDLLPPLVEDEQLKDLVRSLPNNPNTYERVVEAIFATAAATSPGMMGGDLEGAEGPGSSPGGAGSSPVGPGGMLGPLALGELPGVPLNVHVEVRDSVKRVVHDVFR